MLSWWALVERFYPPGASIKVNGLATSKRGTSDPLVLMKIRSHHNNLIYLSWLRLDDEEEVLKNYEMIAGLMYRLKSAELLQKFKEKGCPLEATRDKSKFPSY